MGLTFGGRELGYPADKAARSPAMSIGPVRRIEAAWPAMEGAVPADLGQTDPRAGGPAECLADYPRKLLVKP